MPLLKRKCPHKTWVKAGKNQEKCRRCGQLRVKGNGGFLTRLFCAHRYSAPDNRRRRNVKVACQKCGKKKSLGRIS